ANRRGRADLGDRDRRQGAPAGDAGDRRGARALRRFSPFSRGRGRAASRRPEPRVIGVEPERSNAFHLALAAGEPVPITPESIADGLNAPFAGTVALARARALVARGVR